MADAKTIKDAQWRKGLGIAWFNATNSAITLVSTNPKMKSWTIDEQLENVNVVRDYFLKEYNTYYSEVLANIGANYNASETIARMNNSKDMKELKSIWISLSEDERRDVEILKVKAALKLKYEKS